MLLGIVGTFTITIEDRCLLEEEMFPVVELAATLRRWIKALDGGSATDLWYESMESAEGPLLCFLQKGGGWILHSSLQNYEESRVFTDEEVRGAADHFVADVLREARRQLKVDVSGLLDNP